VKAESIRLQWDSVDADIDGYYIYQTIRAWNPESQKVEHQFDYSNPVVSLPPDQTEYTVELPGVEGKDTKYVWVARCFKGEKSSTDSNLVSHVVSLVDPPAAINLSGEFDSAESIIRLSWEQPKEAESWRDIDHWKVFYRVEGGEWLELATIKSHLLPELDTVFSGIGAGDRGSVEFTVVSYRRSGVFSPNSESVILDIDRRENADLPIVPNFRINIEIPVE